MVKTSQECYRLAVFAVSPSHYTHTLVGCYIAQTVRGFPDNNCVNETFGKRNTPRMAAPSLRN